MLLKFVKTRKVKDPVRGTNASAGLDFFIPDEEPHHTLRPGESVLIKSGIHVKVPQGKAFVAFNKSGIALKKHLQVGACVVDEDYQGEIHIHLVNIGRTEVYLKPGDKIVQFLLLDVEYAKPVECESLEELYNEKTERGAGSFGSTG